MTRRRAFIRWAGGAILSAIALAFLLLRFRSATTADYAVLAGAILGGAIGLVSLVMAAMETVDYQAMVQQNRQSLEDKQLIRGIWLEIRIALTFEEQLYWDLKKVSDWYSDKGQLQAFSMLIDRTRLKTLEKNLQNLGRFSELAARLYGELYYAIEMRHAAWNRALYLSDREQERDDLLEWSIRVYVRMLLARSQSADELNIREKFLIGRHIGQDIRGGNAALLRQYRAREFEEWLRTNENDQS